MKAPEFTREVIDLVKAVGARFMKMMVVDEFTLPDGSEGRWEAPSWGLEEGVDPMVVALTEDGKLILTRIYRFPVKNWVLECAGGMQQPNETVEECIGRELSEETGYEFDELRLLFRAPRAPALIAGSEMQVYLAFGCKPSGTQPQLDPVEILCGMETVERSVPEILEAIQDPNGELYDPPIIAAISVMANLGYIELPTPS